MMVSRFLCSLLSRLLQRGNGSDQRFDQLCRGNPDKNRGDDNDNDNDKLCHGNTVNNSLKVDSKKSQEYNVKQYEEDQEESGKY